ncbi:MAG: hypothetical protein BA863_09995 [Desulfovibrio sp. S3730MH75]|nr:MAG: hypothetical protein BA863_09995 [Desulfovibrio sp. S3730MH75]
MFKKQCVVFAAALLLSLFLAGAAFAKDVTIINGTSFPIHAIALSGSSSNQWGNDILGNNVLYPNQTISVTLNGSLLGWSLAAMDENGDQLEFHDMNLSRVSKITLYSDGTVNLF